MGLARAIVVTTGLLVAHGAIASTSFDGAYHGQARLSRGASPQCGRDAVPVTVAVTDGRFPFVSDSRRHITVSIEVQPDGSFSGSRRYQVARHPTELKVSGRIADKVLDGEIEGQFCSRTYHLTRS